MKMSIMKIREEELMKLRKIISETIFTTPRTESTLLIWALKNLEAIPIDIHMLKTTDIGKVVNRLKNHKSDRVSEIATYLIKKWKAIVRDICEKTTVTTPAPVSAARSAAAKPNAPTSSSRPSLKIRLVVGRSNPKPAAVVEINNIQMHHHHQQQIQEVIIAEKEKQGGMNKEATAASVNVNTRMNSKRTDKRTIETSPAVHSSIRVSCSNSRTANDKATTNQNNTTKKTIYEDVAACSAKSLQSKLETTKRKLHDSYQKGENAKKQRTIKTIDNSDVPKPSRAAAAAAGGTNSRAVKTSKQAAISKRLNMMKRSHLHRSKNLVPY